MFRCVIWRRTLHGDFAPEVRAFREEEPRRNNIAIDRTVVTYVDSVACLDIPANVTVYFYSRCPYVGFDPICRADHDTLFAQNERLDSLVFDYFGFGED